MDQAQAQFLAQYLCKLWEGEFPATVKVIAAVPDDKRSYRPDEKSRTAWELATHLATADVWFADSVVSGKFVFDPAVAKQREVTVRFGGGRCGLLQEGVPGRARAGPRDAC